MALKEALGWRSKIAAKIVLSRLPVDYGFWQRFSLFEHGKMDEPSYAHGVFRRHHDRVRDELPANPVVLEIGPGDSLFSALIARAAGASQTILVDVGPFARPDIEPYRAMARHLADAGQPVGMDVDAVDDLDQLLACVGARYLTGGVESLRSLPDASVDFVWSQAVLEHIRREEMEALLEQLARVMRPGSVGSHRVDLRDHLADGLNNLRFRQSLWESNLMARSGFYTNRVRFSEMLEMFRAAGFAVEVVGCDTWEDLPTPRHRMTSPYRELPRDELLVRGFDVLLRR